MNTNHRIAPVRDPKTGGTRVEVYELPGDVRVHVTRPCVHVKDAYVLAGTWIAQQYSVCVEAA